MAHALNPNVPPYMGPGRWFTTQPPPFDKDIRGGQQRSPNPLVTYAWNGQRALHFAQPTNVFVPESSLYQPALFVPQYLHAKVRFNACYQHPQGGELTINVPTQRFRFWPPVAPGQTVPRALRPKAQAAGQMGYSELASVPTPNMDPSEWYKPPFRGTCQGHQGHWHTVMFPTFGIPWPQGSREINGQIEFIPAQNVVYRPHHEHVFLPFDPIYRAPRDVSFKKADVRIQVFDHETGEDRTEDVVEDTPMVTDKNRVKRPFTMQWYPQAVEGQEVEPRLAKAAGPSNTARVTKRKRKDVVHVNDFEELVDEARNSDVKMKKADRLYKSAGLTHRHRNLNNKLAQRGVRLPGVDIPEDKQVIVTSHEDEGYHYNAPVDPPQIPLRFNYDLLTRDAGRRRETVSDMKRPRTKSMPTQFSRGSFINVLRNRSGSSLIRSQAPVESPSVNNLEELAKLQREKMGILDPEEDEEEEEVPRPKSR